jgi:hypothetical protein
MPRNYLERYGVEYLKPGEGMGYGEQAWDMGYFIDERCSDLGMSNANLAWAQMCYALDMGYPVWGWSNCMQLDRYAGFGDPGTNWSVVNPHAVAGAVVYYPNQVVKALRKMEDFGVREPVMPDGVHPRKFGFRASYDVDLHKCPARVIAGLDQPMIFMALANYLYDGVVWKLFSSNELVAGGISKIKEYSKPKTKYLAVYQKRDAAGPSVKYDEDEPPDDVINAESGADATYYRMLKFKVRGGSEGQARLEVRISGTGGYRDIPVTADWKELSIPLRCMLGGLKGYDYGTEDPDLPWTAMWYDRTRVEDVLLEKLDVPDAELKDAVLVKANREEIDAAAAKIAAGEISRLEDDGTFDRMQAIAGWSTMNSENSSVSIGLVPAAGGNAVAMDFSLGGNGWVLMRRKLNYRFEDNMDFVFNVASRGGPANLMVKFLDSTGATYMALGDSVIDSNWHEVRVPVSSLKYAWGGTREPKILDAAEFQFAVTCQSATRGTVTFSDLKLVRRR